MPLLLPSKSSVIHGSQINLILNARYPSLRSVRRLLVTANIDPSSPILVTLMKETQISSETLVLTRATRRNIPKDTILHSHRRENHKSYMYHMSRHVPIYWNYSDDGKSVQYIYVYRNEHTHIYIYCHVPGRVTGIITTLIRTGTAFY
jgi:hypothetical protein